MPLERAGLHLLLDRLGDPADYEAIRRRLIALFRWEQCLDPEGLTDVVLDRLARKLAEGTDIADCRAYASGIARMVLREHRASLAREIDAIHQLSRTPPSHDQDLQDAVGQLEECLKLFSLKRRDQLLRYYEGDQGARIENRRGLAADMGMALNTLSNRMLRLRRLLADCMRDKSRSPATSGRGGKVR